jgi:hypothetical protein
LVSSGRLKKKTQDCPRTNQRQIKARLSADKKTAKLSVDNLALSIPLLSMDKLHHTVHTI